MLALACVNMYFVAFSWHDEAFEQPLKVDFDQKEPKSYRPPVSVSQYSLQPSALIRAVTVPPRNPIVAFEAP